jgi:protease I
VNPAAYDALVIPGGRAPEYLRLNERVLKMVRQFADSKKPIAALCHGPQVLAAAGVIRGRRLSSYPAVGPEVTAAGGEHVSIGFEEAITDGNVVTGPAWTAHVAWLQQFLAVLGTKIVHEEHVAV